MPSVLETLPTKTVDPGYLGTGQTLQPTNEIRSIRSQTDVNEFLHAAYLYESAKVTNRVQVGTIGGTQYKPWNTLLYDFDPSRADYLQKAQEFSPIFNKYGLSSVPFETYRDAHYIITFGGFDAWRTELNKVVFQNTTGVGPSGFVLTTPNFLSRVNSPNEYTGWSPVTIPDFTRLYGGVGGESTFRNDLLSGSRNWYIPQSTGSGGFGGLFDRVFSTGFIQTFVENPISAITNVVERFGQPVGSDLPQFIEGSFNAPTVDFQRLGIQSGVNTVANIGFAYGVQGVTQGISAGTAASTPLPAGTLGPVSPGFWASVGHGNFANAWQILGNTVGVATGGPSTFLSRQGGNLLLQGAAQQFIKLTGDVGRGILQLVTLDFAGAAQTFTGGPGGGGPGGVPQDQLLFGPTGGGGGGGGYLPSQNAGQSTTSTVILPFMIVILLISVLWYFFRKKA